MVALGVVGVVTGSDQHLDVGILELLHDLDHVGGVGETGSGAQRQVHAVHLQPDAVLQSRQDGGPACAAAAGEHLHDHQLCVGGNAHHTGVGDLVRCGDTGNMGAVVGACVGVGHVELTVGIVEGEGDLTILIGLVQTVGEMAGIQGIPDVVHALPGHGVLQCAVGQGSEAGVIHQNAGIQDGDAHTLAGVAGGIQHVSADHGGGIIGVGGVVGLLAVLGQVEGGGHVHALDAGQGLQLRLVGVVGGHGEAGGGDGVIKAHLALVQSILGQGLYGIQGLGLLSFTAHDRCGLVSDVLHGIGCQQGLLIHDHDEGHLVTGFIAGGSLLLGEGGGGGLELGQVLGRCCGFCRIVRCISAVGESAGSCGSVGQRQGSVQGAAGGRSVGTGLAGESRQGNGAEDHHQRQNGGKYSLHTVSSLKWVPDAPARRSQIRRKRQKFPDSGALYHAAKTDVNSVYATK